MEITVAFVQLYRENAKYLDRPYKWIEKVGLDWVKAQVVDDLGEPRRRSSPASTTARRSTSATPGPTAPKARASASSSPLADLTLRAAE